MLVLVLITFAISWLPLHIFCLWRDFSGGNVHYTKVWFAVHWLAMRLVVVITMVWFFLFQFVFLLFSARWSTILGYTR